MNYLVVDDSKLARLIIIKLLKEYIPDKKIFQAINGLEAIDVLNKEKIDIVFLDLTMPIVNGYEALPKLLEINPDVKIIVISADSQKKAKERIISLGAKMHIQKPINADKMKEIMEAI